MAPRWLCRQCTAPDMSSPGPRLATATGFGPESAWSMRRRRGVLGPSSLPLRASQLILRTCWACGSETPAGPVRTVCGNRSCGASLVPSRPMSLGVGGIRQWLHPDAADAAPPVPSGLADAIAGRMSAALVTAIIGSCAAAAAWVALPWWSDGLASCQQLLWQSQEARSAVLAVTWAVRAGAFALFTAVAGGLFVAACVDPGAPRRLKPGQWAAAVGGAVRATSVCAACGTPKVACSAGCLAVSHSSTAGTCAWHIDHMCVVTGSLVAARSYIPFVRFLCHVAITATFAIGTVVSGAALHASCPAVDERAGYYQPPSLLDEAAKRVLFRGRLAPLATRGGLAGIALLWLAASACAGIVACAAIAPGVVAAVGRNQGGQLAERRKAGLASRDVPAMSLPDLWAGLVTLFGRDTAWATLAAFALPLPPPPRMAPEEEWAALCAGGFDLQATVRLLGAGLLPSLDAG